MSSDNRPRPIFYLVGTIQLGRKEMFLFNDTHNTLSYGYMALDIW